MWSSHCLSVHIWMSTGRTARGTQLSSLRLKQVTRICKQYNTVAHWGDTGTYANKHRWAKHVKAHNGCLYGCGFNLSVIWQVWISIWQLSSRLVEQLQTVYCDLQWPNCYPSLCSQGHITITNYLLNYYSGLDIERRNCHGFTALMKAAMQGRVECVRSLMMAGEEKELFLSTWRWNTQEMENL